jgi:hypothetical protein
MSKKLIYTSIAFLILLSAFNHIRSTSGECARIDPQKVKRLEWTDPLGRQPTSFSQFKAMQPLVAPLKVQRAQRISTRPALIPKRSDSLVAVIVNADIYTQIQTSIDQYAFDLADQGYTVDQIVWSGGDYRDLRDTLQYQWQSSGLIGAVLVGDLPVAWCELNVWGGEEFPIDYYFMELDATWTDSDADGLLEGFHAGSGDVGPEIWLGRLAPGTLVWGSQAQLLQNYFTKNHNYRIGYLSLPHRALSFVDDDWEYFYDCELSFAYGDVTVINGVNQTIASNYKQRLLEGFEWIHLCSHSSCWAHTFKINYDEPGGGSVYNFEVHALQPHALFYNLFACSNTKFMETNNLGNWYIFVDDYGLLSLGSTKSGSMLEFQDFYYPLGQGKSIGDAFKQWFEIQAQDGFDSWEQGWYYGMNILGDPTLTIFSQTQTVELPDTANLPEECKSSGWTPIPVTTSEFSDGSPAVALDYSGDIQTTWESGRDIRSNIYSSSYDGSSWSTDEAVVVREYWDFHPSMARDSLAKVWVAWHSLTENAGYYPNLDISVSYRTPGGWSSPEIITAGPDYDTEPAMTTDAQGRLWVVWKGWRTVNQNVNSNLFARYFDGSWSPRMTITGDLEDDSDPTVAADPLGNIWVVWSTNRNGNWDIYSIYYSGGSWSPLIPVTTDPGDDLAPSVTVDVSGNLWAAWHSWGDGDANIYVSYNNGEGWSPAVQITTHPANDIMPSLSAGPADRLALTWMSHRCGNWDVCLSLYDGLSWSVPEQVTTDPGSDYEPVCLFDQAGAPCVAWASDRDGNWNIYFASYALLPPDLVYPEDLSYICDATPLFEWSSGAKNEQDSSSPSALTYTLQYSTDPAFSSNVTTIPDIPDQFYELPINSELDDTTYWWRVQAVREGGDSSGYQTPFAFTVDTQVPDIPVLIFPSDSSFLCDTMPTFQWSSSAVLFEPALPEHQKLSSSPVRYRLQYSPDIEFASDVTTIDSLVDNFHAIPPHHALNPDTNYFWRVQASDLAGNESGFQDPPFFFSLFVLGDANDDGRIEAGDVVFLLSFLYRNGPEPFPLQSGDANSDGEVDGSDVVYLLNYLYRGGAPPICP